MTDFERWKCLIRGSAVWAEAVGSASTRSLGGDRP